MSKLWKALTLGLIVVFFLFLYPSRPFTFLTHPDPIDPENLTEEYSPWKTTAIFNNKPINVPSLVHDTARDDGVLGENSSNKRIEIDLTNQHLYAYEGDQKVYDFAISSGLWQSTPIGNYRIWIKLRSTLMTGGSKILGSYYYLPNVPYVMYFYNDEIPKQKGFGIHGAYWHNNFGHPMSHGCINMRVEEAGQIYYWAQPDLKGKTSIRATDDNPGTEVIIYGVAADY